MPTQITLKLTQGQLDLVTRTLRHRALQLKDVAKERPSLVAVALGDACRLDALAHTFEVAQARHNCVRS